MRRSPSEHQLGAKDGVQCLTEVREQHSYRGVAVLQVGEGRVRGCGDYVHCQPFVKVYK